MQFLPQVSTDFSSNSIIIWILVYFYIGVFLWFYIFLTYAVNTHTMGFKPEHLISVCA